MAKKMKLPARGIGDRLFRRGAKKTLTPAEARFFRTRTKDQLLDALGMALHLFERSDKALSYVWNGVPESGLGLTWGALEGE